MSAREPAGAGTGETFDGRGQERPDWALAGLRDETRFGERGTEIDRDIPVIDLTAFRARKAEIADQLRDMANGFDFFHLSGHGTPHALMGEAFDITRETEAKDRPKPGTDAGWDQMAHVRPSTGTADDTESDHIFLPWMAGLWPTGGGGTGVRGDEAGAQRHKLALGMKVLSCFADRPGSDRDLRSNLHPVPRSGLHLGPRCSMALLCQANGGTSLQGPEGACNR